ncbi:Uncharacterised protein [Mesomycoplasma hyorhinis]|nr:Uncharacterised protein [Mesomycoplasma hyorhinis]
MIELMEYDADVYLYSITGAVEKRKLVEFLPLAFRKEFLN